jgi:hypothetical protein
MRSKRFFPTSPSAIAAFAAALAFGLPATAAPAHRVEIAYDLTRNGTPIAELVEKLEHDGKTYRLSAQMKGKGLFALRGDAARTSRGSIAADGLHPVEFEDKRTGRDLVRATFDWPAKTLTFHGKDGAPETRPLPPDLQDRLSFAYTFAFRVPGSAAVGVSVTDGKGISTSSYKVAGREKVSTPAGEFDALKLEREKKTPEDRISEIWLAAKHGYVPVRVLVVEKDGTRIDQVATRVTAQ